jgi:hypothetical protein
MITDALLDKSRLEIKLGPYSVAPATALSDYTLLPRVQDYRRQTGSRMYPLEKSEIAKKIPTAEYLVSRKIDGEFTVFIFRDSLAFTLNPGGTLRLGLPWQQEAAKMLEAAGVKQAMVAGELYVTNDQGRRERVHDVTTVARQPASEAHLEQLRFAVFDLIDIDGQSVDSPYSSTWQRIEEIFGGGRLVHPVETMRLNAVADIEQKFADWVEGQGAEGLVVRSDAGGFFKIKPRHTLDAVVIGFTESTEDRTGMMHDLLLAVMRRDGSLQVLCRVGGGFTEDLRREMLSDLKDMIVESEYAEVNSDHVAYQMVRPEWVIEISCLDMISQTTRGGAVNRMVLNWNAATKKYEIIRRLPLVSVISPQFIRRREDKSVNPSDVRVQQIADRVEVPLIDRDASQLTLPKSKLLDRKVYTKVLKGETMVRKFMMWKTNKESESDEFPAYVIHFTDFSPNRKAPLSRDVRVSSSEQQIRLQWEELIEENVKKGWDPVDEQGEPSEPSDGATDGKSSAAAPAKPVKKKVSRKKTAKKQSTALDAETSDTHIAEPPAKKSAGKKQAAKKKTPAKKTAAESSVKAGEKTGKAAKSSQAEKKPRKTSKAKKSDESKSD